MLNKGRAVVKTVYPDSIGEEIGILPGDIIIEINGQQLRDIIDYRYLISEDNISLLIEREGEHLLFEIEKDIDEYMGIDFTSDLFDGLQKCCNKCIFCFVDQTPEGLRSPLYVKDDDYRLSFLYGNFITLNHQSESDLRRIVNMRLSPLYISVHSLNPLNRKLLFGIKKADNIYEKIKFLVEGNIRLHTQIVLCPDINDGEDLDNTIKLLGELYPEVESLAVVPVGITKYREGLYPIKPFTGERALKVINQVRGWQKYFKEKLKSSFVFLADEFYILASEPFPPYNHYEGFPQLENGVGMVREFITPLLEEVEKKNFQVNMKKNKKVTVVSAMSAFPAMEEMKKIFSEIKGLTVQYVQCRNDFWGDSVTVSGLLTGRDIYNSLKNKELGEEVLIAENSVREDGVFLDDLTLEDLSSSLKRPVRKVSGSALDLLRAVIS